MRTEQPWGEGEQTSSPLERWLVIGAIVLFGLRIEIALGVTVGSALVIAFAPVWWRRISGFGWFRVLVLALLFALATGWWLSWLNGPWLPYSQSLALSVTGLMFEMGTGVALFLWARTVVGVPWAAIVYGVALVAHGMQAPRFAESPWRFGLGLGFTLSMFGLIWLVKRAWFDFAVVGGLLLVWAASGGRSAAAVLLIVAVQMTLQRLLPRITPDLNPATALIGGLAIGFSVFSLGQAAVVRGYLGDDAMERSTAQTQQGQNILAGGRPEFGASIALFLNHPAGYGIGAVPTGQVVAVAKQGLAQLGYDPNNGYVETYMFGSAIELHSVGADLWASLGLGGIALVAVLGGGVLFGLARRVSSMRAPPLLVYLGITFIWDLAFSPVRSSTMLAVFIFAALISPERDLRTELRSLRQSVKAGTL